MLLHLCIWCRGNLPYGWEGNLCGACVDRASGTEESGKPETIVKVTSSGTSSISYVTITDTEDDCELVDTYIARIMSLGA